VAQPELAQLVGGALVAREHMLLDCSRGDARMTYIWCDSKECRFNRYGQCMADMVDVVDYTCETYDPNIHIDNNKKYNARRKNEHRLPRD
jgi:hypothetical protein